MSFIFSEDIDEEPNKKCKEVKALTDWIIQPSVKFDRIEARFSKTFDEIS